MQPGISARQGPEYYEPVYKQGNTIGDKIYNAVEDYFYLEGLSKGRKFTLISAKSDGGADVKLQAASKPTYKGWALTALKLLSWVTVVVPVGMWLAHKLHTPSNKSQFKVIDSTSYPNFPRPPSQQRAADSTVTVVNPHPKPQAAPTFQPGKQIFVEELKGNEKAELLTERLQQEGIGCCVIKESRTFLGDYSLEIANHPKTRLLAKPGQGFYYYGTDKKCETLRELLDSLKISKVLIPEGFKNKLEACNVVPGGKVPLPESLGSVKLDTSKVTLATPHDEAIKALDTLNKGCLIEKANDIPGRSLYRFTYDDGTKRVSHIAEVVTEKNRLNPRQIPGELQFYTFDEANKLTPLGQTYGNLQSFLRLCSIKSKGTCRCLVAPEVLEELIKTSKEQRPKEKQSAQRDIPVLKGTNSEHTSDFIEDYLEPFIRREVTPEEAKGRRPMFDILSEQYKALPGGDEQSQAGKVPLKYVALSQYIRRLVEGFYIMLADKRPGFDVSQNLEANSDDFLEYFGAISDAVRFDFKNVFKFTNEMIWKVATDALVQINERRKYEFKQINAENAERQSQSGGNQVQG